MKNILSFLQERTEISGKLTDGNLRGLCFSAIDHSLIEIMEGNRLSEIIGIFLAVEEIVETDVMYIASFKMIL